MSTLWKFGCLFLILQLAEQALKARKEIADFIKAGRLERARIKVINSSVL